MSHPQKRVFVKVPASTANLGPGFDTLGMALNLYAYLELSMATNGETTIEMHGETLHGLPQNKSNLIYEVAQQVFAKAGVSIPDLHIEMYSDIPLTRGLGSSASAIIAALVGANALIGRPLSDDELFQMATEIEGHPDNVGASLFGGIIVSFWDGQRAEYVRLEPHARLDVLVAIPTFQLSTEKARNALPKQLDMADAVFNVGASSLLVAALASGSLELITHAMRDKLHQPYRAALIPGMSEILAQATEHGALGVALSGAGPTLLTFVDAESTTKEALETFLLATLHSHDIHADTKWLRPAAQGVEVLDLNDELTFMERVEGELQA